MLLLLSLFLTARCCSYIPERAARFAMTILPKAKRCVRFMCCHHGCAKLGHTEFLWRVAHCVCMRICATSCPPCLSNVLHMLMTLPYFLPIHPAQIGPRVQAHKHDNSQADLGTPRFQIARCVRRVSVRHGCCRGGQSDTHSQCPFIRGGDPP